MLNVDFFKAGLPWMSFLAWQLKVRRLRLCRWCPPPPLDPRLDHHYYHSAPPRVVIGIGRRGSWSRRLLSRSADVIGGGS
jgi:hypothetical protein